MPDPRERLCYHGRRSIDELVVALNAESGVVALAHKQLSLLHLDRFVATMTAIADEVAHDPPSPHSLSGYITSPRLSDGAGAITS